MAAVIERIGVMGDVTRLLVFNNTVPTNPAIPLTSSRVTSTLSISAETATATGSGAIAAASVTPLANDGNRIMNNATTMMFNSSALVGLGVPDRTSGLQMVALAILFGFPALALVIVGLRTWGRWKTRQFGWDDGLVVVAMGMSIIETAASYKFIKTNYIGIHMVDIPLHDPTEGMIYNYAVQILYNPILALVKSSVLIFLYRLFAQKRGVKPYVFILTTVNLLQMVAVFFAIVFQCTPIEFHWKPQLENGRCVNQGLLYITTASFTILTDVAVLALPAWIFGDLRIRRKTKLALMGVFLLGGLVTAASIARLIILIVGVYQLVPNPDPTYNIGFITSAIETNLALITASAPALTPLLKAWFPSLFGAEMTQQQRGEQKGALRSRGGGGNASVVRKSSNVNGSVTGIGPSGNGRSNRDSEEEAMVQYGSLMATKKYEGV